MRNQLVRNTMLAGTIGVFMYITHVVLGGLLWNGYNHLMQPISDLTANRAPNRGLLQIFTIAYGVLCLLFAGNFTIYSNGIFNKLTTIGGVIFCFMYIISLSYNFFPQDLPGAKVTFIGTMHIVVTALIVPLTICSPLLIGIGLSKIQTMKKMGHFSIVCSILIFVFGGITAIFYANKMPFFGLVERINIGTLQIWTVILSIQMFRISNYEKGIKK